MVRATALKKVVVKEEVIKQEVVKEEKTTKGRLQVFLQKIKGGKKDEE